METKTWKMVALALIPVALIAFTSCATTMSGEGEVAVMETKDGAVMVETFTMTATVTAIDAIKRKVTLTTPDGKRTTFKAGPEVVNFNQIQIGDKVKAMVTEEIAVFLSRDNAPPSASETTVVALAPVGAKPGMLVADTIQITARIIAIDSNKRKVTLQFPDGRTKELKVRKTVDLTGLKPGDDVTMRLTEGIAIVVEKA